MLKTLEKQPMSFNNLRVPGRYTHTPSKGLIVMPDISGFTRFVNSTDMAEGKLVITELLSSILENNILGLKVSEIEGDAVLFYRIGPPPSGSDILRQYEQMLFHFKEKVAEFTDLFHHDSKLSLKLIAHYGEISEYRVGGFEKLYGRAVIESHRLLKNSIDSHSYALLTDDLLDAVTQVPFINQEKGINASKLCQVYGDLRNICFTYFDYN
ncbi:DUF2652 domain-containing protein [Pontibacter silvestris]|uniref:DUF2652 domain-containing protein n=1 Tax=Pontibacter silvestris TaxID=2305183 RepID=A0ABW4X390_9BACT|nr:DUF2652 domain-containing protein [Pontibacter silvestris]MCC9138665.1 DUF2652 domain-containing protein [Pontibacter silvestris]